VFENGFVKYFLSIRRIGNDATLFGTTANQLFEKTRGTKINGEASMHPEAVGVPSPGFVELNGIMKIELLPLFIRLRCSSDNCHRPCQIHHHEVFESVDYAK
jgi:hypothetical protein